MDQLRGWMPVAVAILIQTAGIVWWASSIAAKVHELDAETERQKQVIAENLNRLTKVEITQLELRKSYEPMLRELQSIKSRIGP